MKHRKVLDEQTGRIREGLEAGISRARTRARVLEIGAAEVLRYPSYAPKPFILDLQP